MTVTVAGDRGGDRDRHLLDARGRLPDPRADRDVRPGVVVRLAAPPRARGHAAARTATARPATASAWSGCSRPLMLSQNYHLVHHLHPSIPFYRYVATWRRNEEAYLERDAAIAHRLRQAAQPREFREWKQLNQQAAARCSRCGCRSASSAPHAVFHRMPVAVGRPDHRRQHAGHLRRARGAARRVPLRARPARHGPHRPRRRGRAAQLLDLRARHPRDTLRIAVKHIPGGAFSTFVVRAARGRRRARADDADRAASARRCDPLSHKHYVAIAAGSGITPILSMLQTTLEIETESRFTLIYGNRTERVDDVPRRARRARVALRRPARDPARPLARSATTPPSSAAASTAAKLEALAGRRRSRPTSVDEWFLCGPIELVTHGPRHAGRARRRARAHPPRALLRLREERGATALLSGGGGDVAIR